MTITVYNSPGLTLKIKLFDQDNNQIGADISAVESSTDKGLYHVSTSETTYKRYGIYQTISGIDYFLSSHNNSNQGSSSSSVSEEDFHSFLNSYTGKDNWKADVSIISSQTDKLTFDADDKLSVQNPTGNINANIVQVAGDNVANIAEFSSKNTEAEIHTFLNSYTGKDNWKADVSSISSQTSRLTFDTDDKLSVQNPTGNINANIVQVAGDNISNIAEFSSKNTQAEIHTFLDAYTNKGNWKADVSSLATQDSVNNLPTVPQIEAALLDETDGRQLLEAIKNKISNENIAAADIAQAVWDYLHTNADTENSMKALIKKMNLGIDKASKLIPYSG